MFDYVREGYEHELVYMMGVHTAQSLLQANGICCLERFPFCGSSNRGMNYNTISDRVSSTQHLEAANFSTT